MTMPMSCRSLYRTWCPYPESTNMNVVKLKVRCEWLAAVYDLWRSRNTSGSSEEANNASEHGMCHIDRAIDMLKAHDLVIRTPHLESPGREGRHWKELSVSTLSSLKNELMASSVVSRARMRFRDLKNWKYEAGVKEAGDDDDKNESGQEEKQQGEREHVESDETVLKEIGEELLNRYNLEKEGANHLDELVFDFLSVHGRDLASKHDGDNDNNDTAGNDEEQSEECPYSAKWGAELWNGLPLSDSLASCNPDPSLLYIFLVCMRRCYPDRAKQEGVFLTLLSRLILTAFQQRMKYMQQKREAERASRVTSFGTDDEFDNDSGMSDEESDDGDDDDDVGGNGGEAGGTSSSISQKRHDSSRSSKGGKIAKDELYIVFIQYLMDKIGQVVIATSCLSTDTSTSPSSSPPNTVIYDFVSGADILAIVQVCLSVASQSDDEIVLSKALLKHHTIASSLLLQRQKDLGFKEPPNRTLFDTTCHLISTLLRTAVYSNDNKNGHANSEQPPHQLLSSLFGNLCKILVEQRQYFPKLLRQKGDKRQGWNARQRACVAQAEFFGCVAGTMAELLSRFLKGGELLESVVVLDTGKGEEEEEEEGKNGLFLAKINEALLWFWKYVETSTGLNSKPSQEATPSSSNNISATDRAVAKRLMNPIAAALISLIVAGSQCDLVSFPESSASSAMDDSDFFDSDDSENDCSSYHDDDDGEEGHRGGVKDEASIRENRVYSKMIHTMYLVFGKIGDVTACRSISSSQDNDRKGPLLPLVVARCGTFLADLILKGCRGGDGEEAMEVQCANMTGIWSEEYPYGVRKAGLKLDLLLHKAYRCLHGISLLHGSSGNTESSVCSTSQGLESQKKHFVLPESTRAAAQLYRCIRRAYGSKGRRSPPKAALECVNAALPPVVESDRTKALREYLFCNPLLQESRNAKSLLYFVSETGEASDLPDSFPSEVFESGFFCNHPDQVSESTLVRKGLCTEIARGPLPRLGGSSVAVPLPNANPSEPTASETTETAAEERDTMARYERALSKKFNAVLNHLYHSPKSPESWFTAAQCLGAKAEAICDRLGRVLSHPYDGMGFYARGWDEKGYFKTLMDKEREDDSPPSWSCNELMERQKKESELGSYEWMPCMGCDLSVYVKRPWSTFSSLNACSADVHRQLKIEHETGTGTDTVTMSETKHEHNLSDDDRRFQERERDAWKTIHFMFEQGHFPEWQRAWGGLFVGALRIITKRCLLVSLYLAKQKANMMKDKIQEDTEASSFRDAASLVAEIVENMGTHAYVELQMKGMLYGYPIQLMPNWTKREVAREAAGRFQSAVHWVNVAAMGNKDVEEENMKTLANLHLMVGKCHEKIANTYRQQQYNTASSSSNPPKMLRLYETEMANAFHNYALSQHEARNLEEAKHNEVGGSSHGRTEILYRLHATRLKILLCAVRQPSHLREAAEWEALRLTSQHWFGKNNHDEHEKDDDQSEEDSDNIMKKDLRDGIWEVLSDIVLALAQCRIESVFFHRSVYRHAQALLWAPIFCDPETLDVKRLGSMTSVPPTKAYHLRGMNSGASANSAEAVIKCLFEKKRPQLCAVWTTSGQSPFEVINMAVRKYDSLRMKYIGAHIDCMRLCRRTESLKTFLGWTTPCRRDFQSFYEESAKIGGGQPTKHHSKDSLVEGSGVLWFTKRFANAAMSDIVFQKLAEITKKRGWGDKSDDASYKEQLLEFLCSAYACFIRLNCRVENVLWRAARRGQRQVLEVEVLILAFLMVWEFDKRQGGAKSTKDDDFLLSDGLLIERKMRLLNKAVERCHEVMPHKYVFAVKKTKGSAKSKLTSVENESIEETGPAMGKNQSQASSGSHDITSELNSKEVTQDGGTKSSVTVDENSKKDKKRKKVGEDAEKDEERRKRKKKLKLEKKRHKQSKQKMKDGEEHSDKVQTKN